jgi:tRNA 2-thiouridine synthesizing protein A
MGSDRLEEGGGADRSYEIHARLDTVGLLCPAPIMKTAERMSRLSPGQVLEVVSDDPGVEVDMPAWCKSTGNELLDLRESGGEFHVLIRKAVR